MTILRNTSRRYFVESLLPHYEEFVEYYENRELGLNRDIENAAAAAEDCLNLSEAVFWEEHVNLTKVGVRSEASYREYLWKSQPSYQYVCDFANAHKHRELRPGRRIATIDNVKVVCGVIRYEDKQGFYYDARKLLRIECLDGQTRDLAQMIL